MACPHKRRHTYVELFEIWESPSGDLCMPIRTALDLLRLQGDLLWAGGEFASKILTDPVLDQIAPRGDGNIPVLTLPGFTGPEFSMRPLNRFLNRRGFVADSWGLGVNRGPESIEYIATLGKLLGDRIKLLADEHGRPVSLVGQSLGGIYARELARMFPDEVDRVITLGSPAHVHADKPHEINRGVALAMRYFTGRPMEEHLNEAELEKLSLHVPPPKVPLVAIFSPFDGVAHEDTTAIPPEYLKLKDGVPRENIEIICSHIGMGVNPLVLLAVADRLVADRAAWQPFRPRDYALGPLKLIPKFFFPEPGMVRQHLAG